MVDHNRTVLQQLLKIESGLSEWEVDFLDSIAKHPITGNELTLSKKQEDKLDEIWQKHCGDG